jgi:hypothetical protein
MRFLSIEHISTITSYQLSVVVIPTAIDKDSLVTF